LLRAQYPSSSMPVAIALSFLDTAQYGGTLTTTVKVDTKGLTMEKQPDGSVAALDVAGMVLDDQGKPVSNFNKRFTIKASPNNTTNKPPDNIFYNHFAMVKPGIYQVRVAAIDARNGTRGSTYQWIEVPNVAGKDLTMSSLILGERKSENEARPLEASSNEPQQPEVLKTVLVNVDHRFARSSYLRFLTVIYNAAVGPSAANPADRSKTIPASTNSAAFPDLAVQVQIFRDDEPVITDPLHKIQTEGVPDMQRVPYAADVPLSDLAPGAYVLQVTVIDRLAKSSATRRINFQID